MCFCISTSSQHESHTASTKAEVTEMVQWGVCELKEEGCQNDSPAFPITVTLTLPSVPLTENKTPKLFTLQRNEL